MSVLTGHVLAPAPAPVVAVDVALCAVPLPHPIRLGAVTYIEREYVALRVRTESQTGTAIGYTRGLPVAEALAAGAAALLGRDGTRPEVASSIPARSGDARATSVRATSLGDIALWDVRAQACGLPLWRLLGGERERVPLLAVGGYFLDRRSVEDVEAELRALVQLGYRHLKVHGTDPELVARFQRAAGPDIAFAVDAHMQWSDVGEALEACRALDELGLAFVEDPFAPDRWRDTAELRRRIVTPVAAGEDTLGVDELCRLAASVDVLRVDATTCGGFTPAVSAVAAGAALGRRVMTHAFPDLHAHLAGALPAVELVEVIPYESGANPVDRLMARRQRIAAGELTLSEQPGHGMPLDWDAVERYAKWVTSTDRAGIRRPGWS
ncbi:MAG TPA: enolase C-terminal domain-like protein [Gaiellaceae bacterium]|nr:enolase C-terminal domain-like protein [Gaiellaceae bacterium]